MFKKRYPVLIILCGKCFGKQLSASWNRNCWHAEAKGFRTWDQHQHHSNPDVHQFRKHISAVSSYHQCRYFSDTKSTDTQALYLVSIGKRRGISLILRHCSLHNAFSKGRRSSAAEGKAGTAAGVSRALVWAPQTPQESAMPTGMWHGIKPCLWKLF